MVLRANAALLWRCTVNLSVEQEQPRSRDPTKAILEHSNPSLKSVLAANVNAINFLSTYPAQTQLQVCEDGQVQFRASHFC